MSFNSYRFILAFLPIFILVYFLAAKKSSRSARAVLILGGVVFYAFAGISAALVLALSLTVNLLLSVLLVRSGRRKALLVTGIALDIGLLFTFKYLNFAIGTVNALTHASLAESTLLLPLGISFFTFQQIMYLVSVYRGEIAAVDVGDYLAYILYFPKLAMGPLMEPGDFLTQLHDDAGRTFRWDRLANGLKIFSLGLFKKMVLADTFSNSVTWGIENVYTGATSADLLLTMLFYVFELYFDFSGYTDMAVGISEMLNIRLPINFDSPYKACSMREIWKRWHVSLTAFLTKYVYIPLGGSRKGEARTCLNILLVFLISGLWHGANWTYVLWGFFCGLLQVLERIFRRGFEKLPKFLAWIYTFFSANILWLLTRTESVGQWLFMLKRMFSFENMTITRSLYRPFIAPENRFLLDLFHLTSRIRYNSAFHMWVYLAAAMIICFFLPNNYRRLEKTGAYHVILCAVAFVWGFLCLGSESVFLYFNY